MKRRLSLAEKERLPDAVKNLIDAAAKDVAEAAVEIAVLREVEEAARSAARAARMGSDTVTAQSDLPLLEEAENLAANKKALEAAGFSTEEAMRILIAEIAADKRRQ
ncbi:MAG TPA: hypothetical protein VGN09_11450 [Vicinamibacteria bacterium]|jgi:hypothetical protein